MPKYEDERVYMNTPVRITVFSNKGTVYTQEKISEAFFQFDDVVKKYTRFEPTSELSKLNAQQGKFVKLSKEFFYLVKTLLEVSQTTNYDFDPTIIDLLEAYGYKKNSTFKELDNPELFNEIVQLSASRPKVSEIVINEDALEVKLAPKQRIDLGSIGKGYAIDLAYDVLNEFAAFMINAGGDIRTKGKKEDEQPWRLGLQLSPLPNELSTEREILGTIEVENASLAGSGGWARRVKFFHHLINPKTGLPVNEISQTFILANDATTADVWATALFISGPKIIPELEKRDIEYLIINNRGEQKTSRKFKNLLTNSY